jgi:hypothetical protein
MRWRQNRAVNFSKDTHFFDWVSRPAGNPCVRGFTPNSGNRPLTARPELVEGLSLFLSTGKKKIRTTLRQAQGERVVIVSHELKILI